MYVNEGHVGDENVTNHAHHGTSGDAVPARERDAQFAALRKAREAATKALRLDETLGEAHTSPAAVGASPGKPSSDLPFLPALSVATLNTLC